MDTNRLPKQVLQYKPKGRRNIGRPRKRWRDQLHLENQGTGNTPNPSGTWWWWTCMGGYGLDIVVRVVQKWAAVTYRLMKDPVSWNAENFLTKSGTNSLGKIFLLCGVCLLTCRSTDIFQKQSAKPQNGDIELDLTPSSTGMLHSRNSVNVHCHNQRASK